ncbi:MAG: hypothetical protein CO137_01280 [Candidatus Magasanikbacteria bacterium CG_4_9_14_3_um_filter_32_9]|uniref:Uncharacterized protein n=1 Tax=Candidatus Magasanikbacteria bacterium CG_4_9_14_3_um_filter_32_9 TaxID=1974644 RepID=A0A2M7Z7B3_9BACT|nr:MAG: hypothetical protein CO137_01280 [Candidatus Magasanikbacteria bacterium CG_4_9_14_3_um_filter_32_9]
MSLRKLLVLVVVILFSIISVLAIMYIFSACDGYKNTKITKEYEHMIEVGDNFLVKEKQMLYLDDNPIFLKGTKQEFRNLNKNHSLILGPSCYLVEGGYFKVTDLDCDADGRIKVSFIYYNSSFSYPENNFCPSGIKGWLYINEFILKIKK